MIDIGKLPADKPIKMTAKLHRLFCDNGCDPTCHACKVKLGVKDTFRLATVANNKEVMLCAWCEIEDLQDPAPDLQYRTLPLWQTINESDQVWSGGKWTKVPSELVGKANTIGSVRRKMSDDEYQQTRPREIGSGCWRISGRIVA